MKKILVVDDERDVELLYRQHFRKAINEQKVSFQFAFSGMEALTLMGNQCDPNLVMLTDINMPGMTGLELLQKVKSRCPETVVYIISAYDLVEYHNTARQLGAANFFAKPVDFSILKDLLVNTNL